MDPKGASEYGNLKTDVRTSSLSKKLILTEKGYIS